MRYAQISAKRKLHIVMEAGEVHPDHGVVYAAEGLSLPLCNQPLPRGRYRMNVNMPLGHACKRCRRRWQRMRMP